MGHVLPIGGPPPDAGPLVVSDAASGQSTTLTTSSTTGYGTGSLGAIWSRSYGPYPITDALSFAPLATLDVEANGGVVSAFAGKLNVGADFSGVSPPLGPAPLPIDRSQEFVVAWTPLAHSDLQVMLSLSQITTESIVACYCNARDSSGQLRVSKDDLSLFKAGDELAGSLELERFVVSTVSTDNAVVDLVGAVAETANASFE